MSSEETSAAAEVQANALDTPDHLASESRPMLRSGGNSSVSLEAAGAMADRDREGAQHAEKEPTPTFVYLQACAITIATVLGTGILGLPVKLATSGFTPFLATYSVCLVMQLLTIALMVELMQRAHVLEQQGPESVDERYDALEMQSDLLLDHVDGNGNGKQRRKRQNDVARALVPAMDAVATDEGSGEEDGADLLGFEDDESLHFGERTIDLGDEIDLADPAPASQSAPGTVSKAKRRGARSGAAAAGLFAKLFGGKAPTSELARGPSLHTMGLRFLHVKELLWLFDASVLLHFVSIMISYLLAGSQSYAQLLGLRSASLILPFWILYSAVAVFGSRTLQPVISVLTFAKAGLLVIMVIMTGFVGQQVGLTITNRWSAVGEPFLIGTVALGGAVNTMPVVFPRIRWHKDDLRKYRAACMAGLVIVWLLNVVWCYYLLLIVPQDASSGSPVNLEHSQKLGEISTVPLIEIIHNDYPRYAWVATLVDCFIMLSITVSFVTMGIGLKHTLDGYIRSWRRVKPPSDPSADAASSSIANRVRAALAYLRPTWTRGSTFHQVVLYGSCWGCVLAFAVGNPDGFLSIMEMVTSIALNLESGFMLTVMMYTARQPVLDVEIPLCMSDKQARYSVISVGTYFLFAVGYDIILMLISAPALAIVCVVLAIAAAMAYTSYARYRETGDWRPRVVVR